MPVLIRPAVLLATASVAASMLVAPSAAHAADTTTHPADTTTGGIVTAVTETIAHNTRTTTTAYAADTTAKLTAAEMKVALQAVAEASATAGAGGWKAVTDVAMSGPKGAGPVRITETTVVDPVHGLFSDVVDAGKYGRVVTYAATGKGVYLSLHGSRQAPALKMMGRSSVRYVFSADKSLRLTEFVAENAPDPAGMAKYYSRAGSRTVHSDGSADYRVVDTEQDATVTMHAGPSSVLTGVDGVGKDSEGGSSVIAVDYSYGAQKVSLPAASTTIDNATMAKGVAYLGMVSVVKNAAAKGAAHTRKAAKGGKVKILSLRELVRRDAVAANRAAGVAMVKIKDISGGVRVYATNPWTKKSIAYTVRTTGKQVIVKKA